MRCSSGMFLLVVLFVALFSDSLFAASKKKKGGKKMKHRNSSVSKRDSRRNKVAHERFDSDPREAEVTLDGYYDMTREYAEETARPPKEGPDKSTSGRSEAKMFARELLRSWREQYACLLEAVTLKKPNQLHALEVVRSNLHVRSGISALDDIISLSLWVLSDGDANVALIATDVVLYPILDAWVVSADDTCVDLVREVRESVLGFSSAHFEAQGRQYAAIRNKCMKRPKGKSKGRYKSDDDIDVLSLSLLATSPCRPSLEALGISGALLSRINALTFGLHKGIFSDDVRSNIITLLDFILDVALPAKPPLASHQAVSEAYAMRVGFRGEITIDENSDELTESSIRDLQNAEFYWRSSSALRLLSGGGNMREVDRSSLDAILLQKSKLLFVKQLYSEAVTGLLDLYVNSPSSPLIDADVLRNIGVCYVSIGEHIGALQFLNLTAHLYPETVSVQNIDISIADELFLSGQYQSSILMLEGLLVKESASSRIHAIRTSLAEKYEAVGNYVSAVAVVMPLLQVHERKHWGFGSYLAAASLPSFHFQGSKAAVDALEALGRYDEGIELLLQQISLLEKVENIVLRDKVRVQLHARVELLRFAKLIDDAPVVAYDFDTNLSPALKATLLSGFDASSFLSMAGLEEKSINTHNSKFPVENSSAKINLKYLSDVWARLISETSHISVWVQRNNSAGFVPHLKKQRAFLAGVMQMAQFLLRSVRSSLRSGDPSQTKNEEHRYCGEASWRCFYSIGVRWRGLSQPSDRVLWMDRIDRRYLTATEGSATNLVYYGRVSEKYSSYVEAAIVDVMNTMVDPLSSPRGGTLILTDTPTNWKPTRLEQRSKTRYQSKHQRRVSAIIDKETMASLSSVDYSKEASGMSRYSDAPLKPLLAHLGRSMNGLRNPKSGTMQHPSLSFIPDVLAVNGSRLVGMGIHIEVAVAQRFSPSFREHLMKTGVVDLLQVAIVAPNDEFKFAVISNELAMAHDAMVSCIVKLIRECGDIFADFVPGEQNCPDSKRRKLQDDVIERALDAVYYWHVLNPLTRGSSMLGYMSIIAIALAIGLDIHLLKSPDLGIGRSRGVLGGADPRGVQMDLEAILAPDRHSFRAVMKEVFQSRSVTTTPKHWLSEAEHMNGAASSLDHVFSTRRRMVSFLNFDETQMRSKD